MDMPDQRRVAFAERSLLYDEAHGRTIRRPELNDVISAFYHAIESDNQSETPAATAAVALSLARAGDWGGLTRVLVSDVAAIADESVINALAALAQTAHQSRIVELLHLKRLLLSNGAPERLCDYALFLRRERRLAEAVAVLTQAERRWPNNVEIKCALGQCHFDLEAWPRAAQFAEAALQHDALDPRAIALYLEATIRFDHKLTLRFLRELAASPAATDYALICAHYCLALKNEGDYAGARWYAERYLELYPQGPHAQRIATQGNEIASIIDILERLQLWTATPPTAQQREQLCDEVAKAVPAKRAAVGLFPRLCDIDWGQNVELIDRLAACASEQKRDDVALALCDQALAIAPRWQTLQLALKISSDAFEIDRTFGYCQICDAVGAGDEPEVMFRRAEACFRANDFQQAMQTIERLIARTNQMDGRTGRTAWSARSTGFLPRRLRRPRSRTTSRQSKRSIRRPPQSRADGSS